MKKEKGIRKKEKKSRNYFIIARMIISFTILPSSFFLLPSISNAQIGSPNTDPFSSNFSLIVCDGPALPDTIMGKSDAEFQAKYGKNKAEYKPCNFFTLMEQIQHFINIAIVIGVLAAIVMMTLAGYLYISPKSGDKERAKSIFPKLFWGFIIMLSAWFIVYQILEWIAKPEFKALLGNP